MSGFKKQNSKKNIKGGNGLNNDMIMYAPTTDDDNLEIGNVSSEIIVNPFENNMDEQNIQGGSIKRNQKRRSQNKKKSPSKRRKSPSKRK